MYKHIYVTGQVMKMSEMDQIRQTVLEGGRHLVSVTRPGAVREWWPVGLGCSAQCTGSSAPAACFTWNREPSVPWSSDLSREIRNPGFYVKYLTCGYWQ